jgi:hypothetical protein
MRKSGREVTRKCEQLRISRMSRIRGDNCQKMTQVRLPQSIRGLAKSFTEVERGSAAPRCFLIQEKFGDYGKDTDGQLGFRSFALSSWCAFRHAPAKLRLPIRRHARAREGEAETLRLSLRYLDGSSFDPSFPCFTGVLRNSGPKVTKKSVIVLKHPGDEGRCYGAGERAAAVYCSN